MCWMQEDQYHPPATDMVGTGLVDCGRGNKASADIMNSLKNLPVLMNAGRHEAGLPSWWHQLLPPGRTLSGTPPLLRGRGGKDAALSGWPRMLKMTEPPEERLRHRMKWLLPQSCLLVYASSAEEDHALQLAYDRCMSGHALHMMPQKLDEGANLHHLRQLKSRIQGSKVKVQSCFSLCQTLSHSDSIACCPFSYVVFSHFILLHNW